MLAFCWLILYFLGNRNDGARAKGIGTQWLKLHPFFFCIYLDFFFFLIQTQVKWTFWEFPCFLLYDVASVATFWLRPRACGYLGGRSWLCSGVALSKPPEASFLMSGLEMGIFYSSFSTSTKNSLVLCSLMSIFMEVRWLFITIRLMMFCDGSYVSTKIRKCIFKHVLTTWKLYGNKIQFACVWVCTWVCWCMYVYMNTHFLMQDKELKAYVSKVESCLQYYLRILSVACMAIHFF